jgi:hypothetical protein
MVARMSDQLTVEDLQSFAKGGVASFSQQVGGWVFLGTVPVRGNDWAYRTGAITSSKKMQAIRAASGELQAMIDFNWSVFPVRKAPNHSTFANTVLIGRASTNDIVLDHISVSKLHARIQLARDGLLLSDASSSNGTIVNGSQLRVDEEVPLASGDLVRFGGVALQLFSPEELHALLMRQPRS